MLNAVIAFLITGRPLDPGRPIIVVFGVVSVVSGEKRRARESRFGFLCELASGIGVVETHL